MKKLVILSFKLLVVMVACLTASVWMPLVMMYFVFIHWDELLEAQL